MTINNSSKGKVLSIQYHLNCCSDALESLDKSSTQAVKAFIAIQIEEIKRLVGGLK